MILAPSIKPQKALNEKSLCFFAGNLSSAVIAEPEPAAIVSSKVQSVTSVPSVPSKPVRRTSIKIAPSIPMPNAPVPVARISAGNIQPAGVSVVNIVAPPDPTARPTIMRPPAAIEPSMNVPDASSGMASLVSRMSVTPTIDRFKFNFGEDRLEPGQFNLGRYFMIKMADDMRL